MIGFHILPIGRLSMLVEPFPEKLQALFALLRTNLIYHHLMGFIVTFFNIILELSSPLTAQRIDREIQQVQF